ncbi:putative RNA exonuclease [Pholiota molesta]|nr:putative RNA exonuclease [Pholiota molesta]
MLAASRFVRPSAGVFHHLRPSPIVRAAPRPRGLYVNMAAKPLDFNAGPLVWIDYRQEYLDGMDAWCTEQHGRSGLTQACLDSPHTLEFVAEKVLDYVKKWIPTERIGVLAGNSVHADRMFLVEQMPKVIDHLHYRFLTDVSSIKEISRRWFAQKGIPPRTAESSHRALDDIRSSIRELQWYRSNVFVSPLSLQSHSPKKTIS